MLGQPSVTQVLAPNLACQPAFIIDLVTLGIRALTLDTVLAKTAAAAIQLAIGLLMLLPVAPQWRRAALWGSVGRTAIVWVFGRGAGDLLTGSASSYTGAPVRGRLRFRQRPSSGSTTSPDRWWISASYTPRLTVVSCP